MYKFNYVLSLLLKFVTTKFALKHIDLKISSKNSLISIGSKWSINESEMSITYAGILSRAGFLSIYKGFFNRRLMGMGKRKRLTDRGFLVIEDTVIKVQFCNDWLLGGLIMQWRIGKWRRYERWKECNSNNFHQSGETIRRGETTLCSIWTSNVQFWLVRYDWKMTFLNQIGI